VELDQEIAGGIQKVKKKKQNTQSHANPHKIMRNKTKTTFDRNFTKKVGGVGRNYKNANHWKHHPHHSTSNSNSKAAAQCCFHDATRKGTYANSIVMHDSKIKLAS
jgi:pterin-4a-carbinolamine dehydratase